MIAGQTQLDEKDLFLHSRIGKWIILTWADGHGVLLEKLPHMQRYGSHLATFIFCPHGEEIKGLNVSWLSFDKDNHIVSPGAFKGINATWFFKYSTLRKFDSAPLSLGDVNLLQLPNFDKEPFTYLPEAIERIRGDVRLQKFCHPGYPDDVAAVIRFSSTIHPQHKGALVWVRITGRTGDNHYVGTLLNQPLSNAWKKGQMVSVYVDEGDDGAVLTVRK